MIGGIIDDKSQNFWNKFAGDDTYIAYTERSRNRKGVNMLGEDLTTYLKLCEDEFITSNMQK